jgi:hypothetical protein
MILTRNERENLLNSWGAQPEDIIRAIRANVKVKNQRRQTVRNLNKATLEEKLEKATNSLKRALLMKRSPDKELRALQRQAFLAAKVLATVDISPESSAGVEDEALTSSDNGMVEDSVKSSTLSAEVDDDDQSRMSGLTLSNSTTASMREMENFYRELELDLFGDEELPYMVGQTIECSGVSVVSDDSEYKVLHEECNAEPSVPVTSTGWVAMSSHDQSGSRVVRPSFQSWQEEPRIVDGRSFEEGQAHEEIRYIQPPQHSRYQHAPNRSAHEGHNYLYSNTALLPPGYFLLPDQNNSFQPAIQTDWRRDIDSNRGLYEVPNEPRIYHVPLPEYTSPTRWMEGVDSNIRERKVNCFETLTITEAVDDHHRSDWDRY